MKKITVLLLFCAAALASAQWTQLGPQHAPVARYFPAMVYDAVRDRHVLFGGNNQTQLFGDTWEFDGTDWAEVATGGPSPRTSMAMVYDSFRHVSLMFGGKNTGSTFFGDTWEWDGTAWTQVATIGPSARADMAMAFDSKRHKTVLFGGYGPGDALVGDTWEWDGTSWTNVTPAGNSPSARSNLILTYDSFAGKCVLYGGGDIANGDAVQNDTWTWDGTAWSKVFHGECQALEAHRGLYDPVLRKTVMIGGNNGRAGPLFPDFWAFDGALWRNYSFNPEPAGRQLMAFDYDSKRNAYLLFGGAVPYTNTYFKDTWAWTWPAFGPSSVGLGQSSVVGGTDVMATVTLSTSTGNGPVKISANGPGLTFPPSVLVPPGQSAASFTIHTPVVTAQKTFTIYATINNQTVRATLTVTP